MEHDQHWNDKAVAVISAALVACLLLFRGSERSLNTVAEIVADPQLTQAIAVKLIALGGIPARMGAELNALFVWEDKALCLPGRGRPFSALPSAHLAFLSSESAANAVASSTFSVADLCKPGITLFLQIPPDHLDAMKGLLRCWLSTLIREISRIGCPNNGEVWCVINEASACNGLSVLEETLVRGRSAGIRLLLAYQDESQIRTAFKDKPTLLFSNTDAQIYLGATSYETAGTRISKSCGDFTQTISSYNNNESRSSPTAVGGSGRRPTDQPRLVGELERPWPQPHSPRRGAHSANYAPDLLYPRNEADSGEARAVLRRRRVQPGDGASRQPPLVAARSGRRDRDRLGVVEMMRVSASEIGGAVWVGSWERDTSRRWSAWG